MNDKVITRKDEIRYTTSDPKKMLGRFLSCNVVKKWIEDFVDKSGQVQSVERNELLFEKGTYISQDILAQIRFYMQAGDVKTVEVSNQNRKGVPLFNNFLHLYKAVANISNKKNTFLLYASSLPNANEILTDYIELNRQGGFYITRIEEIDNCFVITDNVDIESARAAIDRAYIKDEIDGEEYLNAQVDITGTEPDYTKMNFYQITARIIQRSATTEFDEQTQTFIVHTYTATRANMLIEQQLRELEEKRYRESLKHTDRSHEKRDVASYIEESKTIPIGTFVPMDFSRAYQNE